MKIAAKVGMWEIFDDFFRIFSFCKRNTNKPIKMIWRFCVGFILSASFVRQTAISTHVSHFMGSYTSTLFECTKWFTVDRIQTWVTSVGLHYGFSTCEQINLSKEVKCATIFSWLNMVKRTGKLNDKAHSIARDC